MGKLRELSIIPFNGSNQNNQLDYNGVMVLSVVVTTQGELFFLFIPEKEGGKRHKTAGQLGCASGHINLDEGEDILSAARREMEEETSRKSSSGLVDLGCSIVLKRVHTTKEKHAKQGINTYTIKVLFEILGPDAITFSSTSPLSEFSHEVDKGSRVPFSSFFHKRGKDVTDIEFIEDAFEEVFRPGVLEAIHHLLVLVQTPQELLEIAKSVGNPEENNLSSIPVQVSTIEMHIQEGRYTSKKNSLNTIKGIMESLKTWYMALLKTTKNAVSPLQRSVDVPYDDPVLDFFRKYSGYSNIEITAADPDAMIKVVKTLFMRSRKNFQDFVGKENEYRLWLLEAVVANQLSLRDETAKECKLTKKDRERMYQDYNKNREALRVVFGLKYLLG